MLEVEDELVLLVLDVLDVTDDEIEADSINVDVPLLHIEVDEVEAIVVKDEIDVRGQ